MGFRSGSHFLCRVFACGEDAYALSLMLLEIPY